MSQELIDYILSKSVEGSPDGSADYVLIVDATGPSLKRVLLNNVVPAALLKTLADAKGDLFVASADDVLGRLAIGSNGQVLYADSGEALGMKWAAPPSGSGITAGIMDAKGDIIVATANDTPVRKAVGANGQILHADSAQSDGLAWVNQSGTTTSIADSATPTPVVADGGRRTNYTITALAQAAAFGAPTGTPVDFQQLMIRIKDNGTARALSWNGAYRAIGITLPTTTVLGKTTYVGFIWNGADSKWDGVATVTQA